MKLSNYAKSIGVSYKTAWRLWKAGKLDAFQLPTGTVIVNPSEVKFKRKPDDKNGSDSKPTE